MSYRVKVLIVTLLIVSIAMATSGFLLISKGYRTSIKAEMENSTETNQFVKAIIESEVLNLILHKKYTDISSLEKLSLVNSQNIDTEICIMNDKYKSILGNTKNIPMEELAQKIDADNCACMIYYLEEKQYVASASILKIKEEKVYVVNIKDITKLNEQFQMQNYYFILVYIISFLIILFVVTIVLYILTKSIYKLYHASNEIRKGNYAIRTSIKTKDEIGDLAYAFNEMADSIEKNVDQIKEENRKKEEFVSNFTHEIKTPLTTMMGYADMIRMGSADEEVRIVGANYIYEEGRRLGQMSTKLFDLFLLEQSEFQMKKIWVDSLLEDIEFIARPILNMSKIELECIPLKACIHGDYEMLKTAFINLLDNARKATCEEDKVVLNAYRSSIDNTNEIVIQVIDNGQGIPEEDIDKITEAFYMVDKSRSRSEGGAGLGLALVSKIVKLHEGKMNIESVVGSGTKIEIRFKEVADYDSEES